MTPEQRVLLMQRKLRMNVRSAWFGGAMFGGTAGWFANDHNWVAVGCTVAALLLLRIGVWAATPNPRRGV